MDIETFKDGSTIELFSRESLLYKHREYRVQIEFDYLSQGFFKTGRLLMASSVMHWESKPIGESSTIDEYTREQILARAVSYFSKRKIDAVVR